MWSHPLAIDDMIVVSDIGDMWSPKIPPDMTEPTIRGRYILNSAPINRAIGIIMEKVPQLVPSRE